MTRRMHLARENNIMVGIRVCLECGGELGMVFRPGEIRRPISSTEKLLKSSTTWRCSTCGRAYSVILPDQQKMEQRGTSRRALRLCNLCRRKLSLRSRETSLVFSSLLLLLLDRLHQLWMTSPFDLPLLRCSMQLGMDVEPF
jgi:uncharacterized protein with PIN domain